MKKTATKTPVTIEQARKEGNNNVNQDIKGRFVGQHVYTCATSLVEYIIKKGYEDREAPFSLDDFENLYSPREGQYKYIIDMDERGEFAAHIEDENGTEIWTVDTAQAHQLQEDGFVNDFTSVNSVCDYLISNNTLPKYANLLDQDEDFEEEPQEIFEYWIVSDHLYDKLKEQGQPVVTDGYLRIWGRTCSGQAILLDYVITRICADMEILQGQQNSWENYK